LRAHLEGLVNASIFLNGEFVGRYWGEGGPQHDFYLMDGFLRDGENDLVLAVWATIESDLAVEVVPYKVILASGNIDDAGGALFATQKTAIPL
jgi:hypothetical protein